MKQTLKRLILDGQGAAQVAFEEALATPRPLTWVRLSLNTAEKHLAAFPEVQSFMREALTAKETRPRIFSCDDCLIATFRAINPSKNSDPENMVSVRVFISENLIITIQAHPVEATDEIEQILLNGAGPKTSIDFLEMLLDNISDKASYVVSELDNQLDGIEDAIQENNKPISRHELNDMRRRIILLRRYLVPQREAINRIPTDKLSWLGVNTTLPFREIADSNTRLIEDLDAERERATVVHEELFSLTQEKMNQKMYLLALVAIIFMPLSFITGLLGINVGGIPGATFHYSFLIVCILLTSLAGLQLLYLWKKKWL